MVMLYFWLHLIVSIHLRAFPFLTFIFIVCWCRWMNLYIFKMQWVIMHSCHYFFQLLNYPIGFCLLLSCPLRLLSTSLVSGMMFSQFTFYFSCLGPETIHFSYEVQGILVGENRTEKPRCRHWMCSLLLGCFCFQALLVDRTKEYIYIYFYHVLKNTLDPWIMWGLGAQTPCIVENLHMILTSPKHSY